MKIAVSFLFFFLCQKAEPCDVDHLRATSSLPMHREDKSDEEPSPSSTLPHSLASLSLSLSLSAVRLKTLTLAHSAAAVSLKSPATDALPSSNTLSRRSASFSCTFQGVALELRQPEAGERCRRSECHSPPSSTIPSPSSLLRPHLLVH